MEQKIFFEIGMEFEWKLNPPVGVVEVDFLSTREFRFSNIFFSLTPAKVKPIKPCNINDHSSLFPGIKILFRKPQRRSEEFRSKVFL